MEEEEFRFHMNRMAQAYTKNAFPGPRLDIIYSKMRHLKASEFSLVCDDIIASTTTTPTIKHFLEAAKPYLERAAKRKVDSVLAVIRMKSASCVFCSGKGCKECSCPFCFNQGTVTAFKRGAPDQTAPYAFRCVDRKCAAKQLVGKGIPPWDEESNEFVRVNPLKGISNSEAYAIANNIQEETQTRNYGSVGDVVSDLANKAKL